LLARHLWDAAHPRRLDAEQNMVINKKLILSIMGELGIKGLSAPNVA
jgi:hypothetical protein